MAHLILTRSSKLIFKGGNGIIKRENKIIQTETLVKLHSLWSFLVVISMMYKRKVLLKINCQDQFHLASSKSSAELSLTLNLIIFFPPTQPHPKLLVTLDILFKSRMSRVTSENRHGKLIFVRKPIHRVEKCPQFQVIPKHIRVP